MNISSKVKRGSENVFKYMVFKTRYDAEKFIDYIAGWYDVYGQVSIEDIINDVCLLYYDTKPEYWCAEFGINYDDNLVLQGYLTDSIKDWEIRYQTNLHGWKIIAPDPISLV
jgi:hypothetical protein